MGDAREWDTDDEAVEYDGAEWVGWAGGAAKGEAGQEESILEQVREKEEGEIIYVEYLGAEHLGVCGSDLNFRENWNRWDKAWVEEVHFCIHPVSMSVVQIANNPCTNLVNHAHKWFLSLISHTMIIQMKGTPFVPTKCIE